MVKSKALKIIVLEGIFRPSDFAQNPDFEKELEEDISTECEKFGEIEKITVFSSSPQGVIIVKFATSFAAQECIKVMNGRFFGGLQIKCFFWDGSTNYAAVPMQVQEAEERVEEARLDEFGDWLEKGQDDLPEEFRLKVER